MYLEHRNFSKKLSHRYKKKSGGAKFAALAKAVQSANKFKSINPSNTVKPIASTKPGLFSRLGNKFKKDPSVSSDTPTVTGSSPGLFSRLGNKFKKDPSVSSDTPTVTGSSPGLFSRLGNKFKKNPSTESPTNDIDAPQQPESPKLLDRAKSFMGRFKKDPSETINDNMDVSMAAPSYSDQPIVNNTPVITPENTPEPATSPVASTSSDVPTPFVAPDLKSLSAAFQILYDVITLIASILMVSFFILAFTDIIIYISRELKQKQFLIFDPNLFNKNTSEFEALKYNTNDQINEPYNIYLEQTIIKQMFRTSGLFFVVVGLQIGSFLALKLLAILKNQEFTDTIEKPKNIGTIIIVLTAGIVLSSLYKSKFLEKIQPDLRSTQGKINNMKDYIYNNLTTNVEFLEAMITNDITRLISIMNVQQTEYSLAKMIFTISLYNYYKSNISENDEVFEEIRKIFTIREIKLQQIDPIKYFYYKQNVFIPNMYVVMKDLLKKSPIFVENGIFKDLKERSFRIMVNSRILDLNRNLLQLLKLPKKKTQLLFYLIITLLISFIFLAMVGSMYKENIMSAWVIIQPILLNIWNKITSLFKKNE